MPLRLKTKLTLSTALLVLAVTAVISALYVARLVNQVVDQSQKRAEFVSQQVFLQAQNAVNDAAAAGLVPESNEPEAIREYVRLAFDHSAGLTSMIESSLGYSPTIYEVTITDRDGVALVSSDASMPGRAPQKRPPLESFAAAGFFRQIKMLYGPTQILELDLPFNLASQPYGEIRVSLNTAFMKREIEPMLQNAAVAVGVVVFSFTLLAALVSHVYLAPLAKISAQLDRISKGEIAPAAVRSADEFGQVSTKISEIGQQLHGVQEIFSTLRENVNHVMAGLDDGLILFTREGKAVMVSPAVQKFLGVSPETLTGKAVSEVFPVGHPLRDALRIQDGAWQSAGPVEVHLNGTGAGVAASRVVASLEAIHESATKEAMGALVILRDVESIERLDSHLQVSERLAALGRVTAGVAHEVKNPLNSMRLWIENLKQAIPPPEIPNGGTSPIAHQAVQILDSEIDRLDRVVKTFLDFSRPVEMEMGELEVNELLREVANIAKPQFAKAGAAVEIGGALEPFHVLGDRTLLKQALLNLTLNALEAICEQKGRSEPGRVRLEGARQNNRITIRVRDNGPGIPAELRNKVFQLYFSTRPGGSGIGLATAFRIVQMHNGSMDFVSEVGRGTTFVIDLPQAG